jgi:sodium transport system permease protein
VPCDLLSALTPLFGACLAVREALRGSLQAGPAAVTWIAGCLWAGLALRALARSFSAERVLAHADSGAMTPAREARTALAFGGAAVLVLYLVGGWLQARAGVAGLLLTLWGLLPVLAWLCARRVAARTGETLAQALALAWPSARHVVGVLCCAPGLAWLVRTLAELQARVAPLPASVLEAAGKAAWLADAGPLALFFVLALSPGICEELFFRGALLSGLRRGLPPGRVVLWQALLFGAAHASVYRFLPSAAVGALLAAIALRTRSVVPAILLHVAYDGLQVLAFQATWAGDPSLALFAVPGLYLLWREAPRAHAGRLSAARVAAP